MTHPRDLVRQACERYGEDAVAHWCADLMRGVRAGDHPPLELLGGHERWADYWFRVWGARGLLYAWDPSAAPAVVAGLHDPAWRVREMSAKVVRLRELGEAADTLSGLVGDEVPRVRAAAVLALARVGEAEHATAIRSLQHDEPELCQKALYELARRLDRYDLEL